MVIMTQNEKFKSIILKPFDDVKSIGFYVLCPDSEIKISDIVYDESMDLVFQVDSIVKKSGLCRGVTHTTVLDSCIKVVASSKENFEYKDLSNQIRKLPVLSDKDLTLIKIIYFSGKIDKFLFEIMIKYDDMMRSAMKLEMNSTYGLKLKTEEEMMLAYKKHRSAFDILVDDENLVKIKSKIK